MRGRRVGIVLLALGLGAAACSSGDDEESLPPPRLEVEDDAVEPEESVPFEEAVPLEGYPTPQAAADDLVETLGPTVGLDGDELVEVRTLTYAEVRAVYETLFPPSRWEEFAPDEQIYVVWIVGDEPLTAPIGPAGDGSDPSTRPKTGRSILAIVDAERRWEEIIFADFDIGDPLASILS